MCDCNAALACARDHLLPLLKVAFNMIRGVPKEIADLKDELESMEDFISNEDRFADEEEDKKRSDAIKARMKKLIEASFDIEDVIDDYIFHEEQQAPDPGCAAGATNCVKTMAHRLQIAYTIQNIKSRMSEIKDTSEKDQAFRLQSSSDKASSSSAPNINNSLFQNLRQAPFHMNEADVVGFEEPKRILFNWLVRGRVERAVVSIVGMGGQGKTTLAKKVFENIKVLKQFDCHVWITVSQSYSKEKLLRDILLEIYKQQGKDPPQSIYEMNGEPLIDEVIKQLQQKRYFVVFDDVWNLNIWNDIEFAMIDNLNGSKVLITTRKMNVANSFKRSSFVEVHELQGLTEEKSLELFNKKAFHNLSGCCPQNLIDISSKIVKKCKGLPLAIVVTGGLLSCKDRNPTEWYKFSENINADQSNEYSIIRKILGFSYHDLPYYLKSCFLYFGLYPEDYIVRSKTLTRQWIAEGFVKEERGRTLEDIAKGYLIELVNRSLVHVVSISIDGRVKSCRVHDLVHAMILEKYEDLSFCKNITEDNQFSLTRVTRRLSMATSSYNLMEGIESSHVRSLLVLEPNTLPKSFVRAIPAKYRRLKVLALSSKQLEIPHDLGSLNHLKFFGFRVIGEKYSELPKSIGMLVNLETLDLRSTEFENRNMPKEVCKLRKLRHFLGDSLSLIHLKDGIGGMTSLQTLSKVKLDDGEDENDNRVVELIIELGKLTQLRELGLVVVSGKYMSAISSSINKMHELERLHIFGIKLDIFIDLDLNSPPPRLERVKLFGYSNKFPEWISKLQNLVKLDLPRLKEVNDAMKLLQSMPNLLSLHISGVPDYEDKLERLHFEDGWFMNLKELYLRDFCSLSNILIDEGALGSLKKLTLWYIPLLMTLPTGIQHLKLDVLSLVDMKRKLVRSIDPDEGEKHLIFKQVPSIEIFFTTIDRARGVY
ncbi:putative P-loop containing nucleoside triphosphate hydrolase, leucine-rich repeat domain, L [Medicago truncatula]|uniref:LRR and NB-ARC domain disease resistance protein n=1 Tax=Medicago truncatula TaxID=3880 RepID=G7J226_MEDTR|nr:disease resistance protein RPM1 [Medicago truncatula]AES70527.1 LRR and NB-ARC domain disease resistance protein [Medicago truncatula]RHN67292.1 putative P-loop containing nucleoside triphosphate hydrolase, leucine-rich repeat domain, L [Medicago truncatula]